MKSCFFTLCLVILLQCTISHRHHHHHNDEDHHRSHRHNRPSNRPALNLEYEWKDLEYDFPTKNDKNQATAAGNYVVGNGVPVDVDVYHKRDGDEKVFMTIPRFTTGIPMTLVTISKRRTGPGGPLLKPYPNYEIQSSHGKDCDGITSVFRIMIDPCKQLWVLDTGRIGDNQLCPPQLLVFDLHNDKLMHRYKFPAAQYKSGSLFVTPLVDVRDPAPAGSCRNAKVYIADVTGYGLVVYDSTSDTSWRVENPLVNNEPGAEIITVAGETFTLPDGILGMAVSPIQRKKKSSDRYLYFHALAGFKENSVSLDVLDNKQLWQSNVNAMPNAFSTVGRRNSQSVAEAMDSNGNLFFGLMDPIAIASWNIDKQYNEFKIRIINNDTLQFASGLKVIKNKMRQEELWILTCRFQKSMLGTYDRTNEINFRIQSNLVNNILKN